MPTPTDLVTDLPADFEVFGQAVDTSLADLQGGTTGQILAKASNTDMDFAWITNDVGDITAVNVTSPITGGGSSGAVTIGIDAATTSVVGAVQLSDSTSTTSSILASTPTATKSAYDLADTANTTANSAYASGFTNNYFAGKNKIINGDFGINQRNFTSTSVVSAFLFDRFFTTLGGTTGTITYTPQVFTPGAAPVAGYEGANLLQMITASYSNNDSWGGVSQKIESVRTLAGQTVTFSFWAKADSGTPKLGIRFQQFFGSGGSPSAAVNKYSTVTAISTSWARYSVTITLDPLTGKTLGTNNDSMLIASVIVSAGSSTFEGAFGSMLQNNTFQIWGWQVEAGSTSTPFQTASGSIGGELALCQRYYYRATIDNIGGRLGSGYVNSTIEANITIPYPVTMRIRPTALEQNGTAADYQVLTTGNTITNCNAVPSFVNAGFFQGVVSLGVASGLVAGQAATMRVATAGAYLGWSAEL